MNKKIILAMCMMSNLWGAGVGSEYMDECTEGMRGLGLSDIEDAMDVDCDVKENSIAWLLALKEPYIRDGFVDGYDGSLSRRLFNHLQDDFRNHSSSIDFDEDVHFVLRVFAFNEGMWDTVGFGIEISEIKDLISLEGIDSLVKYTKSLLTDEARKKLPLRELYIRANGINEIPSSIFVNFSSLTELCLRCNKIEVLHDGSFAGLDNLAVLDLSFNKIQKLPDKVFKPLAQALKELYLSNQGEIVLGVALQPLSSLNTLHLERNKIPNFNLEQLPPHLKTLRMEDRLVPLSIEQKDVIVEAGCELSLKPFGDPYKHSKRR